MQIAFQLTEFNSSGPIVQVPCPSGHTVTGRFYKNSVLKKVKEFTIMNDQAKDGQESTFYMTTPPLKCEVVKSFLASEKVKDLNHPPYSSDLNPCDFFLFPRLKKMLSGNKYTSRINVKKIAFGNKEHTTDQKMGVSVLLRLFISSNQDCNTAYAL